MNTWITALLVAYAILQMLLAPLYVWMGWRLARGMNPAPPVVATVRSVAKSVGLTRGPDDDQPRPIPAEKRMTA